MGKTEIIVFIILTSLIVTIFAMGIFLFAFQYKRKRKEHLNEKDNLNELHQQELLSSQQQTMQHIGTEIHDSVGQKLTLASLYSKQLSANTINLDEKINSISNIIDESLTELRQLSKTLTNPELANAGLVALLYEEAKRINASGVCYLSVQFNERELVLPQADKNILFRLLQEFIQNSLKHSGCRKIKINILKTSNHLSITASDDGKGFDAHLPSGGIGLQNMKRRAEQLNATYDLKSDQGYGTTLNLQFQMN